MQVPCTWPYGDDIHYQKICSLYQTVRKKLFCSFKSIIGLQVPNLPKQNNQLKKIFRLWIITK